MRILPGQTCCCRYSVLSYFCLLGFYLIILSRKYTREEIVYWDLGTLALTETDLGVKLYTHFNTMWSKIVLSVSVSVAASRDYRLQRLRPDWRLQLETGLQLQQSSGLSHSLWLSSVHHNKSLARVTVSSITTLSIYVNSINGFVKFLSDFVRFSSIYGTTMLLPSGRGGARLSVWNRWKFTEIIFSIPLNL